MFNNKKPSRNLLKFALVGAIAGAISSFVFTIFHQILISDIWFSFLFMAIAGIICGLLVSLCYKQLFQKLIISKWLLYNLIFFIMFSLLGIASIIYFDPVTTVAEVIATNERPDELISAALPMTLVFTLFFSVLIGLLYAQKVSQYVIILVTNIVLMLVLGLNVSIIGLVKIPFDSFFLVLELFALNFALIAVYAFSFIIIEYLLKLKNF